MEGMGGRMLVVGLHDLHPNRPVATPRRSGYAALQRRRSTGSCLPKFARFIPMSVWMDRSKGQNRRRLILRRKRILTEVWLRLWKIHVR